MTTAPGSSRLRWLGLTALLLAVGLVAGCTELGLDGQGEDPPGAPHAVTYGDVVSSVQVTNGKGSFVNASWRVPFEFEWRLAGSMQVFTDDARVIAVDEANVTNMTNASAKPIVVDEASFTVLGNQVWTDEDQPAADITFEEGLRVDGDLETAEYEGSGQIEGSNLTLHAERPPIFTFTSPSRITVPDQPPGQATGIGVRTQNTTPSPLAIDGEGIPAPWEAWFTELDARVPAERGEALQLAGSLVQVVRDGTPRFSCRLVLTDAEAPA